MAMPSLGGTGAGTVMAVAGFLAKQGGEGTCTSKGWDGGTYGLYGGATVAQGGRTAKGENRGTTVFGHTGVLEGEGCGAVASRGRRVEAVPWRAAPLMGSYGGAGVRELRRCGPLPLHAANSFSFLLGVPFFLDLVLDGGFELRRQSPSTLASPSFLLSSLCSPGGGGRWGKVPRGGSRVSLSSIGARSGRRRTKCREVARERRKAHSAAADRWVRDGRETG